MKQLLLILSLLFIFSCKKADSRVIDRASYPKEAPAIVYDYSEDGYLEQSIDRCDLSVYNGKVIKYVKSDNTDVVIYFTDGTYMYLDIYKYTPKLKFFKK